MDTMAWLAIAVFAITIVAVISNVVDSTVAALIGVVVMVWIGVMTDVDAFGLVDWNVMAILVSVWIIASYFGKTGVPSWLSVQALRLSGGRPGVLVMILSVLAGVISMFVDNVVVILMMAPVALPLARALKLPVTPLVLMIGFAANFMGSAMLLGDLPPQMLHSVAGAEFMDFFWQFGRPSSFPILIITFVFTLGAMYAYGFRGYGRQALDLDSLGIETRIPNKLFAGIVVGWFLLTVLGMAFRQALGVKLGFIAMTGAITLVLLLELLGDRVKAPDFEKILEELDWRAIFFYIALFAWSAGSRRCTSWTPWRSTCARCSPRTTRSAHADVLDHGADRRHRRARRLHPDLPAHHQGTGSRRRGPMAVVVDAAVVRHAGQQPHGGGRTRALCRAEHLPARGEAQGVAARVPVLERAVHPGGRRGVLCARHADLGAALREMTH